jgi:hypothetical protein
MGQKCFTSPTLTESNIKSLNDSTIRFNNMEKTRLINKKIILEALRTNSCLVIIMNNGRRYAGKVNNVIYDDNNDLINKCCFFRTNYNISCITFKLLNDVPLWYHISGEVQSIYINLINEIIVMNDNEYQESKIYMNSAPLFINRVFSNIL